MCILINFINYKIIVIMRELELIIIKKQIQDLTN
jgi:hypothetical protein